MKNKITSAEYQDLPIQLKNRYTRYSGGDEVYYELIPAIATTEGSSVKAYAQPVKEVEGSATDVLKRMGDEYYEKAYAIIEPEVERLARFVLASNKRTADEFMMAMGTYCFIKKGEVLWDHQWEKCIGILQVYHPYLPQTKVAFVLTNKV